MGTSVSLGSDELRIIGHAINWQLNVPYERTPPPQLTEKEVGVLSLLFDDLCKLNRQCLAGGGSARIEVGGGYACEAAQLKLPETYLRLLTEAVASFFGELQSSPDELQIVTGAPAVKTAELLLKLQALYSIQAS